MKSILTSFLLFAAISCFSQQTINDAIIHGGLNRTYILYIPASYNAINATPLVINFHGYTSNSNAQMYYGDFRAIADTANFILVHPMGTLDGSNQPYWNSGWGGAVDDIGFTNALIDSLSSQYNINQDRVYSTGMSNGGFMSYTLACSLSNRIAAIASVTGTMNTNQSLSCSPQHPVPVMEIHGTADGTVPYDGSTGMSSIANTLNYWVGFNQTNSSPVFTAVPNISTTDGCTAEHYVYENGTNGVEIEHYKIINGGHTWPGAPVVVGTTNYDFNASEKIWQFFAQYDINGKITPTAVAEKELSKIAIYPNPVLNRLTIESEELIESVTILDLIGKVLMNKTTNFKTIDVSVLAKGIYFLKLTTKNTELVKKFVKE
jgi:polyhydroxybutyrate depolymerase